jgi:hypothetical protein
MRVFVSDTHKGGPPPPPPPPKNTPQTHPHPRNRDALLLAAAQLHAALADLRGGGGGGAAGLGGLPSIKGWRKPACRRSSGAVVWPPRTWLDPHAGADALGRFTGNPTDAAPAGRGRSACRARREARLRVEALGQVRDEPERVGGARRRLDVGVRGAWAAGGLDAQAAAVKCARVPGARQGQLGDAHGQAPAAAGVWGPRRPREISGARGRPQPAAPGRPRAMLSLMDAMNRVGSWLTSPT